MRYFKERRKKKIQQILDSIKPINKADKERCRYEVQVSGIQLDDLDDPPREIPFSRTTYKETEKEAIEMGKLEHELGNEVEIWLLVKRWN